MEESFTLREWNKADVPALAKYLNNKKIWDNCRDALPYPYIEKNAKQFIGFVEGQNIQNRDKSRSSRKYQFHQRHEHRTI